MPGIKIATYKGQVTAKKNLFLKLFYLSCQRKLNFNKIA